MPGLYWLLLCFCLSALGVHMAQSQPLQCLVFGSVVSPDLTEAHRAQPGKLGASCTMDHYHFTLPETRTVTV